MKKFVLSLLLVGFVMVGVANADPEADAIAARKRATDQLTDFTAPAKVACSTMQVNCGLAQTAGEDSKLLCSAWGTHTHWLQGTVHGYAMRLAFEAAEFDQNSADGSWDNAETNSDRAVQQVIDGDDDFDSGSYWLAELQFDFATTNYTTAASQYAVSGGEYGEAIAHWDDVVEHSDAHQDPEDEDCNGGPE